jgi:choline dehydrogenase-like flavoprotein
MDRAAGQRGSARGVGTARFARPGRPEPRLGATDTNGRVWGTDRVYLVDGSIHVINRGVNPVVTIMTTAWRTAELMERSA